MAISANLGRDTDHNSTNLVCSHPLGAGAPSPSGFFFFNKQVHSHVLPAHTPVPHSHIYFGYKLPVRHVPLGLASVAAKARTELPSTFTHAMAKYTKEPWLYLPPPLTKERSTVGRA